MEEKLKRLEDKLDSVVVAVHTIDKKVDKLEVQLTEHDAKGSKALVKTVELDTRVQALEKWADLFPKLKAIAGWLAALALAGTYLYNWFKGE